MGMHGGKRKQSMRDKKLGRYITLIIFSSAKHMLLKCKLAGFAHKYSQKENGEHLHENVGCENIVSTVLFHVHILPKWYE